MDGPVGRYFQSLPEQRGPSTQFVTLPGVYMATYCACYVQLPQAWAMHHTMSSLKWCTLHCCLGCNKSCHARVDYNAL